MVGSSISGVDVVWWKLRHHHPDVHGGHQNRDVVVVVHFDVGGFYGFGKNVGQGNDIGPRSQAIDELVFVVHNKGDESQ